MTQSGDTAARSTPTGLSSALFTFMIADVRGYTRFTAEHGDEAAATLAGRFADLVEWVVEARGGHVIELRGDEALAVFPSARNALRASVALQATLQDAANRDPSLPLVVGIGLDAGEAVPVKGGYRGGALNLAARLCSIAGAGEVFCSETVTGLARKTDGIAFLDRGQVRLKGLPMPIRVIQVVPADALPDEVPTLTVPSSAPDTNLPIPPTPFIGRQREVAEVASLLQGDEVRLLTLTGPGGSGKTRLALRTAEELAWDFPDGVHFVSLVSLADSNLVLSTIAAALGVKEAGDRSLFELLALYLRERQILLVLDNFEHLLPAASRIAELLSRCPQLKMVVTSRAILRIAAEQEYPVSPLPLPDLEHLPGPDALAGNEAVRLFVERARVAKPGFALTGENGWMVAEICNRLDGLPLAIELAAARSRIFPPRTLLQRLSNRLALLTGGARDAPTRHQTLRNTIDWSYGLLSEDEQRLFVCLGVFAGGFTYEAADAICGPDGALELLDGLTLLAEKSLLMEVGYPTNVPEDPRFMMLETIREYASEQLAASGEEDRIRQAHASYFAGLTEQNNPKMFGAELKEWEDLLERELDNLRAALGWSLHGDPLLGLRIVASIPIFWSDHGRLTEGRHWTEALLATGAGSGTSVRATATDGAGMLARVQGDFEHARVRLEEALKLYRELGDMYGIGTALAHLGGLARIVGELDWAGALLEESIVLTRQWPDHPYLSSALTNLGEVRMRQGDYTQARTMLDEALALRRAAGDSVAACQTLIALARIEELRGQPGEAVERYREALRLLRTTSSRPVIVEALEGLAALLPSSELSRSTRLWGAADTIRQSIGLAAARMPPHQEDRHYPELIVDWNIGQATSPEDAIDSALLGLE